MPRLRFILALCTALCAGCAVASTPKKTGPPSIEVTGIDGKPYHPLSVRPHRATVLIFVLQDCPICNAYAPEIKRMASDFMHEGAVFYLVQVDPTLSGAEARAHAADYGYSIPVLLDTRHALVDRLSITAVPTAIVLAADGSVQYKGRIDDRYIALGKPRDHPTTRDLRDALAAVLRHEPVAIARTPTVGCAVPELDGGKKTRPR